MMNSSVNFEKFTGYKPSANSSCLARALQLQSLDKSSCARIIRNYVSKCVPRVLYAVDNKLSTGSPLFKLYLSLSRFYVPCVGGAA